MCLLMSRNKKRIEMKKRFYRSFVCHDIILERLDYKRIIRPVFPFDKEYEVSRSFGEVHEVVG